MMKEILTILLITALMLACSSHTAKESVPDGPALILSGTPRQGFGPLHVSFHATLEGVADNDSDFFCLREEWDFGDGRVSAEQPYCEPMSETNTVTKDFFAEHSYEEVGEYQVLLKLGDSKIRSNKAHVLVIQKRGL